MVNKVKERIRKIGQFVSMMTIPNVGLFIAYGILIALFGDKGWFPNPEYARIGELIRIYLIPVIVAGMGASLITGKRGAIPAAIGMVGAIAYRTDFPMLLLAFIMGPLAGAAMKFLDESTEKYIPAGFEMLYLNFSVGIVGILLAFLAKSILGPMVVMIAHVLSGGLAWLIEYHFLPLAAVLIEPAKVLFLNNVMNHSILSPLGLAQISDMGKSVFFLLESNPGPGMGLLLAYLTSKQNRSIRHTMPGAILIHFFGGVHEIYFPYILMNPGTIIGPILGNMAAIFWFSLHNCGLIGPASPGSIFTLLLMTPREDLDHVMIGVVISSVISFIFSSAWLYRQNERKEYRINERRKVLNEDSNMQMEYVKKIVFACDVGMGSSVLGAKFFENKLKKAHVNLDILYAPVDEVPADAQIVVVQEALEYRAKISAPDANIITIKQFLIDPALDTLYDDIVATHAILSESESVIMEEANTEESEIQENDLFSIDEQYISDFQGRKYSIPQEGICLQLPSVSKEEAIIASGELLVAMGYVDEFYIESMLERENLVTTYFGMGVAIPHGTIRAKENVKKSGIVMLQYPDGIDFGEEKAHLLFAIAGSGEEHLEIIGQICELMEEEEILEKMKVTDDQEWVYEHIF